MVVFPGMGRFDAALASIVSSWRSRPGSPRLSRYASWPGGPWKISVSMLDKARWKTASVVVIDSPLSKTSTGWFVSQVAVIDESVHKRKLGVAGGPATGTVRPDLMLARQESWKQPMHLAPLSRG